jgi:hypothetical protein
VQNSNVIVDFEIREWIPKKTSVATEFRSRFTVSIHRFVGSLTALTSWQSQLNKKETYFSVFTANIVFKGIRQWESRGVRNVSFCPNLARTMAIVVRFSLNFAVIFDLIYFRFRPSKSKWIGIVLPNGRNAAIRSMIMRIAYWRSESVRVLRQCAANCKKTPPNTNWKLKTLQIWTPLPIDAKMHRCVNILAQCRYTHH